MTRDEPPSAKIIAFPARLAARARPRAVPAMAVGALAVGALAIGALAIGSLVIGRLAVGRVRLGRVQIDDLTVGKFRLLDRDK
jgi:hypothetical protein